MNFNDKLTQHFRLSEFVSTSHTLLLPDLRRDFQSNSLFLVRATKIACILEFIRYCFQQPIIITSGFRNPALNTIVAGANHSDHLSMLAVDICIKDKMPQLVSRIDSLLDTPMIKPCIRYVEKHSNYIHISFKFHG